MEFTRRVSKDYCDVYSSESHYTQTTKREHANFEGNFGEICNEESLSETVPMCKQNILMNSLGKDCVSIIENADSTCQLNIVLRESSYRGTIDINSCFISASDVLEILTGSDLPDKRVKCQYSMKISNEHKELHIQITIKFQAKKTLAPKVENFQLVLLRVDRTMIKTDIQHLKKRMDALLYENEILKKKIKYSIGYYDPSTSAVNPSFYFTVNQALNECSTEITIQILDKNPKFCEWMMPNLRFSSIKSYFHNESGILSAKFSFDYNMENATANECCNELPIHVIQQWILRWNTECTKYSLNSNHHYSEISSYIRKREMLMQCEKKAIVDDILLTIFELNLEFELKNKNLLPPSPLDPVFKCIPRENTDNKFDLLKTLESLNGSPSETFFNPCIGFYKTTY